MQFNYYSMVEARALVTNYYQPTRARRLWRHYLSSLTGGAGSLLLTVVFYPLFSRRMDTRCRAESGLTMQHGDLISLHVPVCSDCHLSPSSSSPRKRSPHTKSYIAAHCSSAGYKGEKMEMSVSFCSRVLSPEFRHPRVAACPGCQEFNSLGLFAGTSRAVTNN